MAVAVAGAAVDFSHQKLFSVKMEELRFLSGGGGGAGGSRCSAIAMLPLPLSPPPIREGCGQTDRWTDRQMEQ